MKPLLACVLAVLLGMLHGPARADDLDIYGGQTISVQPNVLILFDNSSSMVINSIGGKTRLQIAKETVTGLINRTDNVRFGLMIFNENSEGGRIVQPCGTDKATLVNAVNSITSPNRSPYIYTPLAETLAEAGWYFAGMRSWFNSGVTYTSPIEHPCQKNFIIVMTDGEPTYDRHAYLSSAAYLNGDYIGDYDGDGKNELTGYALEGSDYLDDVAYYLSTRDVRPGWGSADYTTQSVKTYTIGFAVGNQLLIDTAVNGGGEYYQANDTTALNSAFSNILQVIQDTNAIYSAPVIPRNPENKTDAGDRVYMAFFKPQASGRWIGNLKAFGLVNGELEDASTPPVTATDANGNILETALSYWSTEVDGMKVDFGGAGRLLASNTSRNVYTYTGTVQTALTHPSNKFTDASNNPQLTPSLLGVATTTDRDRVISQTLAGVTVQRGDGTTVANWRLGDIIHSEPLVKYYADPNNDGVPAPNEAKSYLFVGANDGMLHVFDAATGGEAWAFIPPGQLANLIKRTTLYGGTEHNYFVDGSPVIETVKKTDGTTMQLLVFGERRGGKRYYALDVTNPDQPMWKYQIVDATLDWDGDGAADGTSTTLGQSWARPQFKKIRYRNAVHEAFLLSGGYDPRIDTETSPANALGRAIYAVKAETATLFGPGGLNLTAANWEDSSVSPAVPYLTHPILEVTGFDRSGQGYMDRLYAGDLGGRLIAARYSKCSDLECTNDFWEPRVIFALDSSGLGRKIMTRPEVTLQPGKECVYFGTGDRENPTSADSVDAIYAVCNSWASAQPQPLTIDNLVDVTANLVQEGTLEEKALVNDALRAGYGWYLRLTNPGEKLVSAPKLLNKKLYFTTYTPGNPASSPDPCTVSYDYGVSRLYAIDYLTGAAVYNFNHDEPWTKEDRSKIIGTSIAGEPVLTTSGATTSLFYGSGGRFEGMPVETNAIVRRYFWQQLN